MNLLKTLFVVPEIRLDAAPHHIPFWAGILSAIIKNKKGQVAILDLNAIRARYNGKQVPNKIIEEEVRSEKWDLIGIGGLTTTYSRIKELVPLITKNSPDSVFIGGGGWSTYNPVEILKLIPQLDMLVLGEGEETFSELYDEIDKGSKDFEKINGLCLRENDGGFRYTAPRALISDLDSIPYPDYDLMETEIYFKYSSLSLSPESFNSKRRMDTVWERGCPRGCTFCSHNGMSRIDLQNIYGEGDRREGEKLVRISDKDNDTFQLPARWPSPEYAVNNVKLLKDKFDVDFITVLDENMTSNIKWTREFCDLYVAEGLDKILKWGTLGDAPSVAVNPDIVQLMRDAGCAYISFGFESASDKVLNQDIQKGQLRSHLQTTLEAIKKSKMTPITTFMIGNPHENIDDLMETLDFWIINDAVVDPFICTPYVGSPLFYDYQDYVLQQYDTRLKLTEENSTIDKNVIKKWKLDALDKFMTDCGDALKATATVSQYFTIAELLAIKQFMYEHDSRRLLQFAHQRYDQTGLPQWKHNEKWEKYCEVCKAKNYVAKLSLTLGKEISNF